MSNFGARVAVLKSKFTCQVQERKNSLKHEIQVIGIRKILDQEGICFDLLNSLLDKDKLKNYDVIILPGTEVLAQEELLNLKEILGEGVGLVAFGKIGQFLPGGGKPNSNLVEEILGTKNGEIKEGPKATFLKTEEGNHYITKFFPKHNKVLYNYFSYLCKPKKGIHVILTFDGDELRNERHPAGIENKVGRGKVYYFLADIPFVEGAFRIQVFDHSILPFGTPPGFKTIDASTAKGEMRRIVVAALEKVVRGGLLARIWHFPKGYRSAACFHIHMDHEPDFKRYVPEILDFAKDEQQLKLSFYAIGAYVDSHEKEKIWRRIVKEGHELGIHGYSHVHYPRLSNLQIKEQIMLTKEKIVQVTHYSPVLFNSPAAIMDKRSYQILEQCGITTAGERTWAFDDLPYYMEWLTDSSPRIHIKSQIIQLPNMMPMFDAYPFYGVRGKALSEILCRKFDYYDEMGELFRLQGHPHGVGPHLKAFIEIFDHIKSHECTWLTSDLQLYQWWKIRSLIQVTWRKNPDGEFVVSCFNAGDRDVTKPTVLITLSSKDIVGVPETVQSGIYRSQFSKRTDIKSFLLTIDKIKAGEIKEIRLEGVDIKN